MGAGMKRKDGKQKKIYAIMAGLSKCFPLTGESTLYGFKGLWAEALVF
jgi:hypothetical protein